MLVNLVLHLLELVELGQLGMMGTREDARICRTHGRMTKEAWRQRAPLVSTAKVGRHRLAR